MIDKEREHKIVKSVISRLHKIQMIKNESIQENGNERHYSHENVLPIV